MFIKYNPKDPHVKTIPIVSRASGDKAIPIANYSIILRTGTNELTEQEWAAIQPHIQDDIKQKIIVPFTVEVKKAGGVTKARTLKDVPVSVARKIIESCQNVADLKKWVKQELPDEIMLLVLKRLRKLKIDPDEFSDELPGEDTLDDDITPENVDTVLESKADSATEDLEDPDKEDDTTEEDDSNDQSDNQEEPDDEIPDFDGNGGGA